MTATTFSELELDRDAAHGAGSDAEHFASAAADYESLRPEDSAGLGF